MEVRVTDNDLRTVVQQLTNENAMLKLNNAALSRTITELEMAQAADKDTVDEKPKGKK